MNSKELIKNFEKIKKETASLQNFWIEFSLFKKNVKDIPSFAKTTKQKVSLYFNLVSNEVHFQNNNGLCQELTRTNSLYKYAQYSKKYNCIILSLWNVSNYNDIITYPYSGNGPFKMPAHSAELYDIVLIASDKSVIINNLCPPGATIKQQYTNANLFTEPCAGLNNAFKEMFKAGLVGGNKYVTFNNSLDVLKFLNYVEPEIKNTPKQQLVNDLVSIKLKEPKLTFKNNGLICVASRVNSEYSALRWFIELNDKTPYEISRLYVNKTQHIFCRKISTGEYMVLNNKLTCSSFKAQEVIIDDKDAFLGTKLEYFANIYKELKDREKSSALYMLTVYPEFEKMYKSGFKDICVKYLSSSCSWTGYLENLYGKINLKEKNITKMLGFNKYQLQVINDKISHNIFIGHHLKDILGDCHDIDNTSFDAFVDFLSEIHYFDYLKLALQETIRIYSLKTCIKLLPNFKKLMLTEEISNLLFSLHCYLDYIRTVELMNATHYMRPNFNNDFDIEYMHQIATDAYNIQKSEFENKRFEKRIDIWKKWEYDNEKFCVITPKKPSDLAREGIELHHCVKSYIDRVAEGKTNIVFIRKKDDVDTPFFTVEISNTGSIEQVHGFANRNANTEPELENFIKEWGKKRKLKLTNYTKIR